MRTNTRRSESLRRTLNTRRDTARSDLQARLRDGRAGLSRSAGDDIDVSDARAQSDLELALLEMTSDTLTRIDAAIGRMDRGAYGVCVDCGDAIAELRLRALPFAARCHECQDRHEHAQQAKHRANRGSRLPALSDRFVS